MTTTPADPPPFPVLIDAGAIARRTAEIAAAVARRHDTPPLLVAVMLGAAPFARRLAALLPARPCLHEVRARSYHGGTESSGVVRITGGEMPVEGAVVLLLEDIIDTGRTVAALRAHFAARGAAAVEVATLLSKPARRVVDEPLDDIGFEIPDAFVIGYGMDVAGRYRELPHVAVYDAALERG